MGVMPVNAIPPTLKSFFVFFSLGLLDASLRMFACVWLPGAYLSQLAPP